MSEFRVNDSIMVPCAEGGWCHRQRTKYERYLHNRLVAWFALRSAERSGRHREDVKNPTSLDAFCLTYKEF